MENLKESVLLRKYQNLDPITEYRSEVFQFFQGLEDKMRLNAVFSFWQSFAPSNVAQAAEDQISLYPVVLTNTLDFLSLLHVTNSQHISLASIRLRGAVRIGLGHVVRVVMLLQVGF